MVLSIRARLVQGPITMTLTYAGVNDLVMAQWRMILFLRPGDIDQSGHSRCVCDLVPEDLVDLTPTLDGR